MLKVFAYGKLPICFKGENKAHIVDGNLIVKSHPKEIIKGAFAVGQWKYFVIEDTNHATS